jgi:hypothetical protein
VLGGKPASEMSLPVTASMKVIAVFGCGWHELIVPPFLGAGPHESSAIPVSAIAQAVATTQE